MKRILVIRGGALGDFVLTLPAIKMLRDRFPRAHIEILGHKHIIALTEKRFYADAIRSIESAQMAGFFAKDSALAPEWAAYFGSFDLILSYLFDPDGIFAANLRRCGVATLIMGPAKLGNHEHAAHQLAKPLELLGLRLENPGARIFLSEADRQHARAFLGNREPRLVAIHPGSGSETKNWPIENWRQLGEFLFSSGCSLLVIVGEADEQQARFLESAWQGKPVQFVKNETLPRIAALLESALFVGHDSGISHLAAAVGARCLLLFGPTDPAVWAPANESVSVLQAPDGNLQLLTVDAVIAALKAGLSG